MNKKTLKGSAYAVSAGCCWGSMAVSGQYLMQEAGFAATDLVAARLLGAGALLFLIEAFVFRRDFASYLKDRRDLAMLFVYGLVLAAVQLTFFLAIAYANANTAAIMVMT
ncbi:MAG: EamA family transporter, partial [Duodenibacillus sp.]|nr:EamA family transporter [Duodenibacillus sp.]